MKKLAPVLAALAIALATAIPAAAYTVGQTPPTGITDGAPYLRVVAGGRDGYIYLTAAQIETLAIGPGDKLSVILSGLAVPTYPGTAPYATRLYTYAFFPAPDGDAQISILAGYLYYNAGPSTGAITYSTTVRWGWLTGGTNLFNGTNPSLISGDVIVMDTNIPQFSPKNNELGRQSPNAILMTAAGALVCICALLFILRFIGGFRKSASSY